MTAKAKKKKKKEPESKVRYMHFTVRGEDLTRIARDIMREGRWQSAFKIIQEGLIGITYEQTVSVLNGLFTLGGDSDEGITLLSVKKSSKEYKKYISDLAWAYSDIVQLGASRWYRPYAFVSSYGANDVIGPDDTKGHIAIPHRKPRKWGDYDQSRAAYYSKNPVSDELKILKYAEAPAMECAVLFERCTAPPLWWEPPRTAQQALDNCAKLGKRLDERGTLVDPERGFEWPMSPEPELDDEDFEEDCGALERTADKMHEAAKETMKPRLTAQQMMTKDLIDRNPMLAGQAAAIIDSVMGDGKEMDEPPEPNPKMDAEMGYITPDGTFWGCEYMHHRQLAYRILVHIEGMTPDDIDDEEQIADKRGWIRAQQGILDAKPSILIPKKATQRQQDTLFDWCEKHGVKYPTQDQLGGYE